MQHSIKPWVCCALSEKNSYGRGLEIIDENGLEASKLKEKLAVVSETAEDSDESTIESGDENNDGGNFQDENEQLAIQQFRNEWRLHRESSASSFVIPWHLDEAEEPPAARISPRADDCELVLDIQSAGANGPVTGPIQHTQRSRTNAEQHSQSSSSRRSLLDDVCNTSYYSSLMLC